MTQRILNMKKSKIYSYHSIILLLSIFTITGCPGPKGHHKNNTNSENSNSSILLASCNNLICSIDASDAFIQNADIATYECDMDDGTVINVLTAESLFDYSYASSGTYSINCTTTSSTGETDTSTTHVTVGAGADGQIRSIADAGSDQAVNEGDTVFLDASGSAAGSVGEEFTYYWTKWVGGGSISVSLSDRTAQRPSFVVPANARDNGSYIKFSLSVGVKGSRHLGSTPDYVVININPRSTGGEGVEAY